MKSKVIKLPRWSENEPHLTNDESRISIAKCRQILEEEGEELSDEDILKIRDFFYRLAAIGLEEYQYSKQHARLIYLEQHKITENEKGDYLRAG
ncbi:hypothetical protein SAMN05421788_11585 [Filimonas lacunae]|uniref:Uncharacterized protein n=1 Tax=Filimonas lacunae TaxID=477680 RepID=A0A173MBW6_9BACT|nr:hypothetical protein [Filimonas lacunae]BAV05073.1 hypothetical protein FLA_1080 [Filimonas lacunae]SIT34270.1 hypothetical protein SAMN05421788_11585 [Filimonas lacunae]